MKNKPIMTTVRIPLFPTDEQKELFNQMYSCYVRLSNEVVTVLKQNPDVKSETAIRKMVTPVLYEYYDLSAYTLLTVAVREKRVARARYGAERLNYKKEEERRKSFPVRCDAHRKLLSRVHSEDLEYLKIPSIPDAVKISRQWLGKYKKDRNKLNDILNCKKQTARMVYDGKYWYLVFSRVADVQKTVSKPNEVLGVGTDLNNQVTTSDMNKYYTANISRKSDIEHMQSKIEDTKKAIKQKESGGSDSSTLRERLFMQERHLRNIKLNELHEIANKIVSIGYENIALSKLSILKMHRECKGSVSYSYISSQGFRLFNDILEHSAKLHGQNVVIIKDDKTKICNACGHAISDNSTSRYYVCPKCGLRLETGLNTALNLRDCAKIELSIA